jgi:molybdenum cofactor biosynthesis protein B
MAQRDFTPLTAAVLTVSDTRTPDTDTSGDLICERMITAGHRLSERQIVKDDLGAVREAVQSWLRQDEIDVVLVTGGTGITPRDITPEALEPLVTKPIVGFGELFRHLSYEDISAATIQSRAFAGLCGRTLLFALPGSTGAVRLAMDLIIISQLDCRTEPCNFAMLMPRIREEPPG